MRVRFLRRLPGKDKQHGVRRDDATETDSSTGKADEGDTMTGQFAPLGRTGPFVITRRRFIQGATAAVVLAGCGGDEETTTAQTGKAPGVKFSEPNA